MQSSPNLARVASLIGDPSRIAMLLCLIGGKALPASELARAAKITPQTASSHLAKLVEGGLLTQEAYGRHRYYQLANAEVAHALEALQAIASPQPVRSLRESDRVKKLHFARTCYDHLAGKIGVALTDRLVERGFIRAEGKDFLLTAEGQENLKAFGVEVEPRKGGRHFARQCLDWSERRPHLAGSLGASLTRRLFELGWIERFPDGRVVRLTAAGTKGLSDQFGLRVEEVST
ncbi:helix-turn-helix transcriptional regulator [Brevibacillus composti]|uniref:Helix-turn-helix transcriptional regulator n=1 Tax=Brevibacillus composti TaxID=2796470 RepID=A0A7T5EJI2_9BACL|nr:metalloregulator ArsR/SmtB family transcription factor [Brevibacillus composti]QQE73736.1 helix-turn-helix transcriptional regulator [Brevibacillus composti]QUO40819.1 helix-turn-helix transcriptional regulator [Brevibacillus composti]